LTTRTMRHDKRPDTKHNKDTSKIMKTHHRSSLLAKQYSSVGIATMIGGIYEQLDKRRYYFRKAIPCVLLLQMLFVLWPEPGPFKYGRSPAVECSLVDGELPSHHKPANLLDGQGFRTQVKVQFWPDFFDKTKIMRASQVEFVETYSYVDSGRALIEVQVPAADSATSRYYIADKDEWVVKVSAQSEDNNQHDRQRLKCERLDRRSFVKDMFERFTDYDQIAESWLEPAYGLPEYFMGMSRLLLIFDANRDKMKSISMKRIRDIQALRYDLNINLGALEVAVSAYLADGALRWSGSELPLRIWFKTKKHGLMMVDYYRVDELAGGGPTLENLNYYVNPLTVQLGLGCSVNSTVQETVSTFHEIYSMEIELTMSARRREFLAYDGIQEVFRRDVLDSNDRLFSTKTIFDGRRLLRFNVNQVQPVGRRALAVSDESAEQGECVMAPHWVGASYSLLKLDFVKMGTGIVRGLDVIIYEHVSDTPPEIFMPPARYTIVRNDKKLESRSVAIDLGAFNGTTSFSTIYYITRPIPGELASVGRLLRVDVMSAGRLLEQINIFNFAWYLRDAPNGDKQENLFSLPASCYESIEPTTGITALKLELGYKSSTSSMIGTQLSNKLVSSVPVRTNALMRGLIQAVPILSATRVLDIESVIHDSHKDGGAPFKIYANVKLALGHRTDCLQLPILAVRVIVQQGQRPNSRASSYEECFYEAARKSRHGQQLLFAFIDNACYIDSEPIYEINHQADGSNTYEFTYSNVFRMTRSPSFGHLAMRIESTSPAHSEQITSNEIETNVYDSLTDKMLILPVKDPTHPSLLFESLLFDIQSIKMLELSSAGHTNEHLEGLGLINGRALKSSEEQVVNQASCQAACMIDLGCRSYSVCTRGLAAECRLSDINFNDANLLAQLKLNRKRAKDARQHQVSFNFQPLDASTQEQPISGDKQRHVELFVDKRCQIHTKQSLDMFTWLQNGVLTSLKKKTLIEVDSKEECAELCLRSNMEYFVQSENLFDGKTLNTNEIKKRYFKALKTWCSTFRYLNLKASSVRNQHGLNKYSKDGLCMLPESKRDRSEANRARAGDEESDEAANVLFEMDVYEFKYVNLYEARPNTMILAYGQNSTDTNEPSNRKMFAHMGSLEKCARACFVQTTELDPYCKSFEFVRKPIPRSDESHNRSRVMTECSFNSMNIDDTIKAGLYDKIVVNKVDPTIVSLNHYELHGAYLNSTHFMEKFTETNQRPQETSGRYGPVLTIAIIIMALISGIFIGSYAQPSLMKRIATSQGATSIKRRRFSNGSEDENWQHENL
jgi:hypothetical protein